jgi:hypothetical protein
MSDFLTRLASRQLGQITTIEPRVAPLYGAANETRNPSFAEETGYRPAARSQEAVVTQERTPLQSPPRTEPLTRQPLVEGHASHNSVHEITALPFTAEISVARPTRSSADQSPVDVSQRRQPDKTESLPQDTMLAVPTARTRPAAPVPLVNQIQSESAPRLNEFPAPIGSRGLQSPFREQPQKVGEASVHVTIGRIEVRAITPPVPSHRQRPAPKTMSLDEYLGKRGGA